MYRLIGTVLVAGTMMFAQTTKISSVTASSRRFATEAAIGGMAEVEMGKLAASKATNSDVKNFGQRMVDDHSKAGDQLKSVATGEGIKLPTAIDAKHKAIYDRLSKLSGAAFDRAYVKEMVKDHEADVKEFERESQSGSNAALKDFAAKTLPTLQEHLRMIKDIDAKMPASE